MELNHSRIEINEKEEKTEKGKKLHGLA